MKKQKLMPGYICNECAEKNYAFWPEGHQATFHAGFCDVCNDFKNICHTSDWNWPLNKPLERNREI